MKSKITLLAFLVFYSMITIAQEPAKFGIEFSGFVKTDIFWDSRQTVSIRDGHFLLYPRNELLDPEGNDINAKSSFNILSIQTRLTGKITGPDALGAKTSGLIEGAFFGHSDGDINGFRLRHAFIKLNWPKTELLVGQYWHPMFITSSFPEVISFNTGAPFQPFSRNPQIRLTQQIWKFRLIGAVLSQIDFKDAGPPMVKGVPTASTAYLRNSAIPELSLRFEFSNRNEKRGCELLAGIGGDYKILTPTLVSDSGYKTDQTVSGYAAMFYTKWKSKPLTVKLEAVYGQLFYSLTMLGGYAVEDVSDAMKGYVDYKPVNTLSFWTDINTNGKKWQVGLFGGYTRNLGSDSKLLGPYYSRGSNIAYIYRISPRFIYNSGKFRFAPELEYTVAAYGKTGEKGMVENFKEVGNFRILLGVFYFF